MKTTTQIVPRTGWALAVAMALTALAPLSSPAQSSEEFKKLQEMVGQLQKTVEAQNARIAELEKEKGKETPPVVTSPAAKTGITAETSPSIRTIEKIAAGEQVSTPSPVTYRDAMNNRQEAASRPKDFTLDPKYRGFIPVPNTPVLVKFNAKPRVDVTVDNENAGTGFRFVPALFPMEGSPEFGGGEQSTVNANGSQLSMDVRAPEMGGNFRFYYQNDFFGSNTKNMQYRLQQLYGQFYGVTAGFTYGIWEDPDIWPDTVDYEGPNAVIFSRRPVVHYTQAWNDNWNTTFGVEQPDIYVDLNTGGNANASQVNRMPDLGFNTRYEKAGFGHVQFSALFRNIGAQNDAGIVQNVLGWGVNLQTGIDLTKRTTLQLMGVYGEGVGGQGNDTGFLSSDAAYTAGGNLEALPYWSAMAGITHRWSEQFRSTVTYGYVNLDPTSGQVGTFYHTSQYASANIIWQLRKKLSIGLEALYGFQEAQNGVDSGNHWRAQMGLVYSLFD